MLRNHFAMDFVRELTKPGTPQASKAATKPDTKPVDSAVLDAVAKEEADAAAAAAASAADAAASVLDATEADRQKDEDREEHILDNAGTYAETDLALKAAAAVQEWAETVSGDLDKGEGLGDRFFALLAGVVDDDLDGELSEEEAELLAIACEHAADYLMGKGVPEEDALALVTDFDNELADSVQELVAVKLPDGDEAAAADIDAFVFGDGSDEAVMDAVYKKRIAVRQGKKVRINKRISGKVRLSAAQKVAIRKMIRKSHSAKAQLKRAKSMRVRQRAGL